MQQRVLGACRPLCTGDARLGGAIGETPRQMGPFWHWVGAKLECQAMLCPGDYIRWRLGDEKSECIWATASKGS